MRATSALCCLLAAAGTGWHLTWGVWPDGAADVASDATAAAPSAGHTSPPSPAAPTPPPSYGGGNWSWTWLSNKEKHYVAAVTPMCFAQGVGWVWLSEKEPPAFSVKAEGMRDFRPARVFARRDADGTFVSEDEAGRGRATLRVRESDVTWAGASTSTSASSGSDDGNEVPFLTFTDALALARTAQLYHFIWPLVSSMLAAEYVRSLGFAGVAELSQRPDDALAKFAGGRSNMSLRPLYTLLPTRHDFHAYSWLGPSWVRATRTLYRRLLRGEPRYGDGLDGGADAIPSVEGTPRLSRAPIMEGLGSRGAGAAEWVAGGVGEEEEEEEERGGFVRVRCYERGLVGATDVRHYASAHGLVAGGWDGRVKCNARRCRFRRPGQEHPAAFAAAKREFHANVLRAHAAHYGAAAAAAAAAAVLSAAPAGDVPTALTTTSALVVDRRGSRSIVNVAAVAAAAADALERSVGSSSVRGASAAAVRVVYLEDLTVLQQYDAVLSSHLVFAVHGSAFAWCLVGAARTVWVELVPEGSGRTHVLRDPKLLSVDSVGIPEVSGGGRGRRPSRTVSKVGMEGYGLLTRYGGGHHVSWYANCPGCTVCPPPSTRNLTAAEARFAPARWKLCNVTVSEGVAARAAEVAVKIRKNPEECRSGCQVSL